MLTALSYYPGTVEYLLETYAEVNEDKLADLLVGYLDPTEHATQVGADGVKKPESDDDEEEENVEAKTLLVAQAPV